MGIHRKVVRLDPNLTTAMTVTKQEIILNRRFVETVKTVYLAGKIGRRRPDGIVSAVTAALRAQRSKGTLLVSWNSGAIKAALDYLDDGGQIKLPEEELSSAA